MPVPIETVRVYDALWNRTVARVNAGYFLVNLEHCTDKDKKKAELIVRLQNTIRNLE